MALRLPVVNIIEIKVFSSMKIVYAKLSAENDFVQETMHCTDHWKFAGDEYYWDFRQVLVRYSPPADDGGTMNGRVARLRCLLIF